MLRRLIFTSAMLAATLTAALAEDPVLPATATKATQDQFIGFIDGKTVDVVIYDADKPLTATLKWEWKKKRVTGTFVFDGKKKGKVNVKWSFDGDKACTQSGSDPKTCHDIFLDGDSFIEMREDGKVHAISKIKS